MQPNGERTHSLRQEMQPGLITWFHHPALLCPSIAVMQSSQRHDHQKHTNKQFSCFSGFLSALWLSHCQKHLLTCDLVLTDSAPLNSSQCSVPCNCWVYYQSEGTLVIQHHIYTTKVATHIMLYFIDLLPANPTTEKSFVSKYRGRQGRKVLSGWLISHFYLKTCYSFFEYTEKAQNKHCNKYACAESSSFICIFFTIIKNQNKTRTRSHNL